MSAATERCWHGALMSKPCAECPGEVSAGGALVESPSPEVRKCIHKQSLLKFCTHCSKDDPTEHVAAMRSREPRLADLVAVRVISLRNQTYRVGSFTHVADGVTRRHRFYWAIFR